MTRQKPQKVELHPLGDRWFLVKISYPGDRFRWTLRRYVNDNQRHFVPCGRTFASEEQAREQFPKEQHT